MLFRSHGKRELRASGARSLEDLAIRLRSERPVVLTQPPSPRIAGGMVLLNDPAHARAFLATFTVTPMGQATTGSTTPAGNKPA